MKILLVLFTFCICTVNAFAQLKYNPLFLIPYNDHNKWGWCDTLGTVQVTPEFEKSEFFREFDEYYLAEITQNNHRATYVLNQGVTGPKEYNSFMVYDKDYFELKCSIITDSLNNFGLYSYKLKKVLITPQFEYGYEILHANNEIFVYRNSQRTVCVYDLQTGKTIKTKYTSFQKDENEGQIYFYDAAGDFYFLNDQKKFQKSTEDIKLNLNDGTSVGEYDRTKRGYNSISQMKMEMNVPKTIKPIFGIELDNYKEYVVGFQDGKYGVLESYDRNYVPFTYDYISIDYDLGYFYLLKDKNIGLLIPNRYSAIIQPKYEYLHQLKVLKSSYYEEFKVFEAGFKQQTVLIGENGIEYYNFK